MTDIVTHYRGSIRYWDVLNEANNAAAYANGVGAWMKRDGAAPVVATTLAWAREASKGTNNRLLYNDFNVSEKNVELLRQLQARRALPDAIGIQSHMHGGNWTLARVWQVADRFGRFSRPVHFTEMTVLSAPGREGVDPSRPPADWTPTAGEAQQARYLEQLYPVLFSHPAVQAITYWDLSDRGAWQNAPAGLLRRDMSPKPAYDRLKALIRKEWWTRTRGATDARGRCRTRVFHGDHLISVTDGRGRSATRAVTVPTGSAKRTVHVSLP